MPKKSLLMLIPLIKKAWQFVHWKKYSLNGPFHSDSIVFCRKSGFVIRKPNRARPQTQTDNQVSFSQSWCRDLKCCDLMTNSRNPVANLIFLNWANIGLFLFIFRSFQHTNFTEKNSSLQRDLNSDHRSRRKTNWPLDHSGQSYKLSTVVIYDSIFVLKANSQ